MIELLILFELNRTVLTMYGIAKNITDTFGVLTKPGFGTIKPALKRLEKNGYLKTQKEISQGGRRSTYYSITKSGFEQLKFLITEVPADNPINFLTSTRIKLACADILTTEEQKRLICSHKVKAESIYADIQNLINTKDFSFYPKMVFDNLICEYRNIISLLEGFEHACTR